MWENLAARIRGSEEAHDAQNAQRYFGIFLKKYCGIRHRYLPYQALVDDCSGSVMVLMR